MRLIGDNELMKHAHDVTLANGAKHRCIDATVIYEIPTVDAIPVEFVKESIEILKFNGMLSGALLFETLLNDWKANTERKEDETS